MNPVFEKGEDEKVGKIIPIYSLTENITNNEMIKIIKNAIRDYISNIKERLPRIFKRRVKFNIY